jgi:hypothetical protein
MLGRVPPNGLTLNCAATLIGKGFEPLSTYQIDTILLAAQRRQLECTCWAAQPLHSGRGLATNPALVASPNILTLQHDRLKLAH